jgi:hypothetical protein
MLNHLETYRYNVMVLAVGLACLLFVLPVAIPFVDACTPASVAQSTEDNTGPDPAGNTERTSEEVVFVDWIKATRQTFRNRCASIPPLRARSSKIVPAHARHTGLRLAPLGAGVPDATVPLRC